MEGWGGGRAAAGTARRRHLEVAEDEQKDEEIVDGEAVFHDVRGEEVEGRRAALEGPHTTVEGQRRSQEQPKGLEAVVVHGLDRAR